MDKWDSDFDDLTAMQSGGVPPPQFWEGVDYAKKVHKPFIHSLLEAQKEEFKKMVSGMEILLPPNTVSRNAKTFYLNKGYNEAIKVMKRKLEETI